MLVRHPGVQGPDEPGTYKDAHPHANGGDRRAGTALLRRLETGNDQRKGRRGQHDARSDAQSCAKKAGRAPTPVMTPANTLPSVPATVTGSPPIHGISQSKRNPRYAVQGGLAP